MPNRKDKICIYCKHYFIETPEVEGECLLDEDINIAEHCDSYEKGINDGK